MIRTIGTAGRPRKAEKSQKSRKICLHCPCVSCPIVTCLNGTAASHLLSASADPLSCPPRVTFQPRDGAVRDRGERGTLQGRSGTEQAIDWGDLHLTFFFEEKAP